MREAKRIVATSGLIFVAFMGSVIVTPLYSIYQDRFGFSDVTLTLVYAVYVVGNVTALVLFGQISDQVGRRRASLPGLVLAAGSAVAFLMASSTWWLFLGRLLIGLAVGILSGTGTAWVAEQLGPERSSLATVTSATANLLGIATGPLVGAALAEYVPGPLVVPFVAYVVLVVCVAVAVLKTSERSTSGGRHLRAVRVRPRLGVPRDRWGSFAAPGTTGFVTFALGGLYFALIPGIVIRDLGIANLLIGGLVVFELGIVAVGWIVLGRRIAPGTAMTSGLVALVPAVGLVVAAQAARSLPLLVLATVFAGTTMGLGYRGSLQVVNRIAPEDRRAELVSTYFICCFVGNSVPVIGVGVLTTLADPLVATAVFAVVIAALGAGAMSWHRRTRWKE